MHFNSFLLSALACFGLIAASQASATQTAPELYKKHCSSCHGSNRFGQMGPALLPENLKRLRKKKAAALIRKGLPATQMPSFEQQLSTTEIEAVVKFIYSKPLAPVQWTEKDIRQSQIIHEPNLLKPETATLKPIYQADPLNLFLVVEKGDHHITVLDGDKLTPIHRFKSRYALHGGPKYTDDGRYVYFASRDGWVSKFDMYQLKVIAEARVGINTRNVAVSADGRYLLAGNYLPHTLVLLDAHDLSLIKAIPVEGDLVDGKKQTSRVSAVYTAPPRESFIVALKDLKEIWEIYYADNPPKVFNGYVHDYRMGEGLAETGGFPIRKIKLKDHLDDFFFDQSYQHVIGASRESENGQVINLLVGKKIADLDLAGMPHLGSGITWPYQLPNGKQTTVLATPHYKTGGVSIIDMNSWQVIKKIPTKGPGFFMRSHENSPYAWVDVFFGPHKDLMHVIDKKTLEVVKTLRPRPGKTSAHIEFTRDGSHALLSIWDIDGEVIVYDAKTLQEVKYLPMKKPVGKYNVYNKITRSEGTSH